MALARQNHTYDLLLRELLCLAHLDGLLASNVHFVAQKEDVKDLAHILRPLVTPSAPCEDVLELIDFQHDASLFALCIRTCALPHSIRTLLTVHVSLTLHDVLNERLQPTHGPAGSHRVRARRK